MSFSLDFSSVSSPSSLHASVVVVVVVVLARSLSFAPRRVVIRDSDVEIFMAGLSRRLIFETLEIVAGDSPLHLVFSFRILRVVQHRNDARLGSARFDSRQSAPDETDQRRSSARYGALSRDRGALRKPCALSHPATGENGENAFATVAALAATSVVTIVLCAVSFSFFFCPVYARARVHLSPDRR